MRNVALNALCCVMTLTAKAQSETDKYNINIASGIANGAVATNPTSDAIAGAIVKVTAYPYVGYILKYFSVRDIYNNVIDVSSNNTFVMPASDVTVSAKFKQANSDDTCYTDTIYSTNEIFAATANGTFPVGWLANDNGTIHQYGLTDGGEVWNYNWGGNVGGGGCRSMTGYSGGLNGAAIYWRSMNGTNELGTLTFGEQVKDYTDQAGNIDPEMPKDIALYLEARKYQITIRMCAWKNLNGNTDAVNADNAPIYTFTLEDLEGNVYARFDDVKAMPNVNGAQNMEVTNVTKSVTDFTVPNDGYYMLKFSTTQPSGEYLLGGVDLVAEPISNAPLTKDMFKVWDGVDANASVVNKNPYWSAAELGTEVAAAETIYGNTNVINTEYADLTGFDILRISGTKGMQLRVILNRQTDDTFTELKPVIGNKGFVDVDLSTYEYVHVNAIKIGWDSPTGVINSLILNPDNLVLDTEWDGFLAGREHLTADMEFTAETHEQTIYIANTDTNNKTNITFDGLSYTNVPVPINFERFTIEGVAVTTNDDGSIAYSCDNVSIPAPSGFGTEPFNGTLVGTQASATECPILTLDVTSSIRLVAAFAGTSSEKADSALNAQYSAKEPKFTRNENNTLTITSATEGATIYYTLDGTEPTTSSSVFVEALPFTKNGTVKAMAVKEGLKNSIVKTYEVDWFKVEPVQFSNNGRQVTLTTATEETVIRYTIDGTEPTATSPVYTEPLILTGDCTVKAIAQRDGYATSDVASFVFKTADYTVATPEFAMEGYVLTISTTTENASIYYTLDGTEPTTQSNKYEGSVTLTRNCTVKAMAVTENWFNSTVETYEATPFKVETVQFNNDGRRATLTTATEETVIRYTIDGTEPTATSPVYTEPLILTGDCTVKAIAMRDGYTTSDVTSFVFNAADYTVAAPEFAMEGYVLTITTTTENASIYYTLDGTEPTTQSTKYEGSVTLMENKTVKALAVMENWFSSAVETYEATPFKVDAVQFSNDGRRVTLTTATANAVIRYSIDGTEPMATSTVYAEPLILTGDCTVKAIAMRDGYTTSDVKDFVFKATDYTVTTPEFTRNGNSLAISTATENASIYYTLDGTEPTTQSTKYEGSVTLTRNCTVKAMAVRENWFDSAANEYVVNDFTAAAPTFARVDDNISISQKMEGESIYYTLDANANKSDYILYNGVVTLSDNRPIKAYVKHDGWNDSEVATFTPNWFKCENVTIIYNGHYFHLTANEGATIHYTIDGTMPTASSPTYSGATAVSGLCTIKAIAMKQWMNNSDVTSMEVKYYGDSDEVTMKEAGSLRESFEWCNIDEVEELTVNGEMNATDLETLRSMTALKHLDLKGSSLEGNALPNEAFAGMDLVDISLPATISAVGANLFKNCKQLAAINWKSSKNIPATALSGIDNPNLLLYVPTTTIAVQTGIKNIIANGTAQSIELTDAEDGVNNNFYCPEAFVAQKISYTHKYTMTTGLNRESRGWETIALPFNVQAITHEDGRMLAPFAANDSQKCPFWLLEVDNDTQLFTAASKIEANKPYIISMPNNKEYGDEYNLAGNVTFSASGNVNVPATQLTGVTKGYAVLTPVFQRMDKDDDILVINEEAVGYYPEGSIFLAGERDARPFEVYATISQLSAKYLPIFDDGLPSWIKYPMNVSVNAFPEGIYNLQGIQLKTPKKGINIINGKQMLVK